MADCVAWDQLQVQAVTGTVSHPLRVSADLDCLVGQRCRIKMQLPNSSSPWKFEAYREGTAQSPGRLVVHFLHNGADTSTVLTDNASTQIPIGKDGSLKMGDRWTTSDCSTD